RHLMKVLDGHCDAVGRDPATVCRTFINMVIVRDTTAEAHAAMPDSYRALPTHVQPIMGTREDVVAALGDGLAAGIDGLIVSWASADRGAEYIARLAELASEARS